MKKYVIAALSALTLAGCTQGLNTANKNPMAGETWVCVTNYYDFYDIGVRTNDIIQFDKEGVYTAKGIIVLPIIEKPLFVYHQDSFGKWEYKNNELTLFPAHVKTTSAHSKETLQKLKAKKKLREVEKAFSNTFEQNTEPMTFKIIKQEDDTIMQEQKLGKSTYYPFCMKGETLSKKVKAGEIKLNPNY